MLVINNSYHL